MHPLNDPTVTWRKKRSPAGLARGAWDRKWGAPLSRGSASKTHAQAQVSRRDALPFCARELQANTSVAPRPPLLSQRRESLLLSLQPQGNHVNYRDEGLPHLHTPWRSAGLRVLRPLWWPPRLLLAAGAPTTLLPDHKDRAMLPRRRAVTSQAPSPWLPALASCGRRQTGRSCCYCCSVTTRRCRSSAGPHGVERCWGEATGGLLGLLGPHPVP